MGRLVLGLLSLALAGCPGTERVSPPPPRLPRIVVLLVIDQFPTWTFDRDRALFRHGLARLLHEGGLVRAELPYASPFTAVGHASIGTGAAPSVHGIVGNTWYRRPERRERTAEHDPDSKLFVVGPSHGGELSADDGASAKALRVDGLAEALRTSTGGRGKSIAVGLKPRAAAFIAGRRPDLAVWYEAAAGGMTTSRAYTDVVPPWLVELARTKPATRFFDVEWVPRDPALLARVTEIADDAPGEGSVHGLDTTFPHPLGKTEAPYRAFLHTPYADELVFDVAEAALDAMQLGSDEVPDLLALSFNARDYAGHLWGPDAWETLELTLRLDERLGRFFELLDRRYGRTGWSAVLTSDHGATHVVERSTSTAPRRIRAAELMGAAESAIEASFGASLAGKGPWVAALLSSNLYVTPAFLDQPIDIRRTALSAAATALAKVPGIATAGRVDGISGSCPVRNGLERAICLSIVDGESGELYVMPLAGSLISDYKTGTHHDAPFDDNRQVPILVMAPGVAPQTGKGSLLQVAPTIAALLGVPPPAAATEAPLFGLRPR